VIIGVGTDILEVSRMERAVSRESFCRRVFTEEERRQAGGRVPFLAGCFAVKEAVVKCFGTGFIGVKPDEVEALRDSRGRPYVRLYGGALRICREMGGTGIHVSISDAGGFVTAFAVMEGTVPAGDAPEMEEKDPAGDAPEMEEKDPAGDAPGMEEKVPAGDAPGAEDEQEGGGRA